MKKIKLRCTSLLLVFIMIANIVAGAITNVYAISNKEKSEHSIEEIEVKDKEEESILFRNDEIKIKIGEKYDIEYYVETSEDNEIELIWSSDDNSIATVKDGQIVAIGEGETIVRAKYKDKNVANTCKVQVIKPETSIYLEYLRKIDKPKLAKEQLEILNLEGEKSYSIINNSSKDIYINYNGDYKSSYDIVYYNSDKSIKTISNQEYRSILLSSGESIKISVNGINNIEFYVDSEEYKELSIEEVEEKALYKVNLENEKYYDIKHEGQGYVIIGQTPFYEGMTYDVVEYNSDGGIQGIEKEYSYSTWLQDGETAKISTGKNENIVCWVAYEQKEQLNIQEISEPILYNFTLKHDTTYHIKNKGNQYIPIAKKYDIKYNYIRYDADGKIISGNKDTFGNIDLYENETMKISISDKEDIDVCVLYEQKEEIEINELEEPIFYEFVLSKGKNYEITNLNDNELNIYNNASDNNVYDIVKYDEDNNIISLEKDKYPDYWFETIITLEKGEKARISLGSKNEVKFWLPYEQLENIKEVENPALYTFKLDSETNYEIRNDNKSQLLVGDEGSDSKIYDIVHYDNNGGIKLFRKNLNSYNGFWGKSTIILDLDEKVRISLGDGEEMNFFLPYEYSKNVQKVDEKALYEFNLEKDKNYEIYNSSDNPLIISNTSNSYEYSYDIERLNKDGTTNSLEKGQFGEILLNAGEKVIVSHSNENSILCWIPYEQQYELKLNEEGSSNLYEFKLEKNKNYEIKNNGEIAVNIGNTSNDKNISYDMIIYESDGDVSNVYKDKTGAIRLLKGQSAKIYITGESDIDCWLTYELKDNIECKVVEGPLFYEFILEKNKTYKINNNSGISVNIKNDSSYDNLYEYILYKPDSTYKYLNNKYGDINLNNSEYMIISPNIDNKKETISVYLPYEYYTRGVVISEVSYDISDMLATLSKVKVNINKQLSKLKEQEEVTVIKDSLYNYKISIYNKTTNKNIDGWQIKGDYIVFEKGTTLPKNTINIKLYSKRNDCIEVEYDIQLDENNNASMDVNIQQLGYIKIDEQEENKNSVTNRTLIFDNQGKHIESISTNSNKTIKSKYLKPGKYTIVLLKSSGDLWRVDSLNQFDERDFIEGEDYIKYEVEVYENIISYIEPKSIPIVDEDRISFFDKLQTMVTSNTEVVSENGLLEIRIQYKFKDKYAEQNITNKSIIVNLPEEVDFIENSLIIDNNLSTYNISADREELIIPINNMDGIIKFNVRPIESKKVTINIQSTFNYNNKIFNETLGIVTVDINYLTINGPQKTNSKKVRVYGIAPVGKKVSVYNGSDKLKEVVVLSSGKWIADIELKNAYNGSNHNIFAKIDADNENEKVSNKLTIKYTSQMPTIKKLTMYYNNGKSINLTSYMKEGKSPVVTIVPNNPLTFELELENGNESQEFYIISERNGENKSMKFTYDSKKGVWIASGFFDPNNKSYVPGTLRITYKSMDFLNDILYIDFESKEFKESLPDEWVNAEVEVKKDTEDGFEFDINLNDENETTINYKYNISKIPSNMTESNITSKGYTYIGNRQYIKEIDIGNKQYNNSDNNKDDLLGAIIVDFGKGTINDFYIGIISQIPQLTLSGKVVGILTIIYDFMKTNKELTECIMSINPDKIPEVGALTLLQNLKFLCGIVIQLVDISRAVQFVPILLAALEYAIISAAANLGYLITDKSFDYWQEKLCGGINDLGEVTNKWLIDPSGYVYEAVNSNRIEGVTTTVYYKDENGKAIKWDAEEYDQVNPLITDKEGKYAWDVPEGLWQVKYEKEGYETTYSEWLPVPPPQTEVNIGMVSYEKTSIELFNIYENRAEITFNKYMDVSTINTSSIKLKDNQNNELEIEIEPFEQEETKDKKIVAKKFILKINNKNILSLNNEYTLTVKNTAKTYAEVSSDSDIIAKTIYKPLPTEIKVYDKYEVNYDKEINIPISIDNISNSEEFEVIATSSMNDIASIVTDKVKFDKNGKAIIKVLGQLPGEAELTFKIEGSDLESKTKVNVLLPNENNLENTQPTIEAKDIELIVGDDFRELEGVTAYDKEDGDITSRIVVIENNVNTSTAGIYKVVYEVRDNNGSTATKEIKVTVKPKLTLINRQPKIEVEDIKIVIGSIFEAMSIVKATDYEDGDITNKIEIVENTVNTSKAGVYKVVYKVVDSKGAIATKTITVTVESKDEIIPPNGGGTMPTPPIQKPIVFNDIKGHWAEETIKLFTDKKIINGYEDNTFRPDNSMTRAEFVKVVNRVFGYSQKGTEQFTDVNKNDWYYEDICIGVKEGYIKGKSTDIFAPNDNITRQEVAMILTNIMKNKDKNLDKLNTFKDGDKTSQWAQSSVEGAIEAGYIEGYEDKTIRANGNITRAEAISMLSRIKNK